MNLRQNSSNFFLKEGNRTTNTSLGTQCSYQSRRRGNDYINIDDQTDMNNTMGTTGFFNNTLGSGANSFHNFDFDRICRSPAQRQQNPKSLEKIRDYVKFKKQEIGWSINNAYHRHVKRNLYKYNHYKNNLDYAYVTSQVDSNPYQVNVSLFWVKNFRCPLVKAI
jgi:hypothetical protein